MNYRETLEFLSRRGNEVRGARLGLHRIDAFMQAMGSPHLHGPVLHIGGTNGKGSVAAMSESILRHAGYKTGMYTSPHLVRPEERIRVEGRDIPARSFARAATRVRDLEAVLRSEGRLDMNLTYFEFVTACAFLAFAEEKVDVAVVEVGLGGALDATNIVDPEVAVITGVALDHQEFLGSDLGQIAREKAGIIKPGAPVISGAARPRARREIRARAAEVGAPLVEIDRDCEFTVLSECRGGTTLSLRTPRRTYPRLRLSLAGAYQARNAALAVAAVESLPCCPVRAGDVARGLAGAEWAGRLDLYRAARNTLLDAAHNPEGARALRDHLRRCGAESIHMVFGVLRDKDYGSMGRLLFPSAQSIHLTPVANLRSASPSELVERFPRYKKRFREHAGSAEALRAAWRECPPRGLVVVTGSIYLLGELLTAIRRSAADRAAKKKGSPTRG